MSPWQAQVQPTEGKLAGALSVSSLTLLSSSMDFSSLHGGNEEELFTPGSLAVTAAQLDGQSPTLNLGKDETNTLLGRRSNRNTPTAANSPVVQLSSQAETPDEPEDAVIMTVTAYEIAGESPSNLNLGADSGDRASIFNRRKSKVENDQLTTATAASFIKGRETVLEQPLLESPSSEGPWPTLKHDRCWLTLAVTQSRRGSRGCWRGEATASGSARR
eukprot:767213-Hanusia_phi.AAC.6